MAILQTFINMPKLRTKDICLFSINQTKNHLETSIVFLMSEFRKRDKVT
jgi:hypothetical protein